ncbi:MAG: hypothetical protein IJC16_09190 [Rikenellaceae bacterium]|nr:hypothetical protein [Rikenellaceae bacterium]
MLIALVILYVVTLVYFAITERFRNYATLVGLQGWILMGIALMRLHGGSLAELLFVVVETLVFKAVIVPAMLFRIIRRTGINRVSRGAVSVFDSLLLSVAALGVSIGVTYYIADTTVNMVFFGVALYALISGLLLVINRRRIFSHLVGFLVIENGVFLFAMAIGAEMPFLINIAILLDILISVLMLGMFLSKIGAVMHDLDADRLTTLKD